MSDKVQPIKSDAREFEVQLTALQIRFLDEALSKVNVPREHAATLADLDTKFTALMKKAGNES